VKLVDQFARDLRAIDSKVPQPEDDLDHLLEPKHSQDDYTVPFSLAVDHLFWTQWENVLQIDRAQRLGEVRTVIEFGLSERQALPRIAVVFERAFRV
jgi:hypothetical protein